MKEILNYFIIKSLKVNKPKRKKETLKNTADSIMIGNIMFYILLVLLSILLILIIYVVFGGPKLPEETD